MDNFDKNDKNFHKAYTAISWLLIFVFSAITYCQGGSILAISITIIVTTIFSAIMSGLAYGFLSTFINSYLAFHIVLIFLPMPVNIAIDNFSLVSSSYIEEVADTRKAKTEELNKIATGLDKIMKDYGDAFFSEEEQKAANSTTEDFVRASDAIKMYGLPPIPFWLYQLLILSVPLFGAFAYSFYRSD